MSRYTTHITSGENCQNILRVMATLGFYGRNLERKRPEEYNSGVIFG
jgi:hypothetical protein